MKRPKHKPKSFLFSYEEDGYLISFQFYASWQCRFLLVELSVVYVFLFPSLHFSHMDTTISVLDIFQMKRAPGAKQECLCSIIIFKIITGMLSFTIYGFSLANYFFPSLLVKLGFVYMILQGMVIGLDHLLVIVMQGGWFSEILPS